MIKITNDDPEESYAEHRLRTIREIHSRDDLSIIEKYNLSILAHDATPHQPEYYKNGEQCGGCGAPLLTNGIGYHCEYCGGGLKEKKPLGKFKQGGQSYGFKSLLGVQFYSPNKSIHTKLE